MSWHLLRTNTLRIENCMVVELYHIRLKLCNDSHVTGEVMQIR